MQVKLWAVREEMADEQGEAAINNKSLSTVHRILQELATNSLSSFHVCSEDDSQASDVRN